MQKNLEKAVISQLSQRKADLMYDLEKVLDKLNIEVKVEEKI